MTNKLHFFSRSHVVSDWKCPRARYYNYEYQGKGLVKGQNMAFFLGTIIHDALASIAYSQRDIGLVDIDLIATTSGQQVRDALNENLEPAPTKSNYVNEQSTLVEGLLRAFHKHTWPRLMTQYPKIVAIEQELDLDLGNGMVFMSKPDLILEDSEGEWHYIEYKSTSSKKDEWIQSWNTAVQVHSSIRAVEKVLGKAPIDVTILGLYKGWTSYGKLSSPIVYAYKRNANPPFTKEDCSYEYKPGYKKVGVWELPGGIKEWIEGMPENILTETFPMTPPIMFNESQIDAFFRQAIMREQEIDEALDLIHWAYEHDDQASAAATLDESFPQRFDMCSPAYGFDCDYKHFCFGNVSNPAQLGFVPRVSHHAAELEAHNAQTV